MMTEADPYLGDLGAVDWDPAKDDFDFGAQEIPQEVLEEFPEMARPKGGMERDEFDRLVGAEKFGRHLAKVLNWHAKVKGVPEVSINEADQSYSAAVEVLYTRLMDGPGRYLLPYLTNRDLIDLWIVGAWGVPYAIQLSKAITAKKKAARSAAMASAKDKEPKADQENGGSENG